MKVNFYFFDKRTVTYFSSHFPKKLNLKSCCSACAHHVDSVFNLRAQWRPIKSDRCFNERNIRFSQWPLAFTLSVLKIRVFNRISL